jgi:four helix bundle protein
MATYKRFEDLEIWKLARQQCIDIENLIKEDLYRKNQRLKDQIQGSSGSVMDNIAEGFEKESTKEFINYLFYAKGSSGEMRSQLIRMSDFGYYDNEKIKPLISMGEEISRQIKGFIKYLKSLDYKGYRYSQEPSVEYEIKVWENVDLKFSNNDND